MRGVGRSWEVLFVCFCVLLSPLVPFLEILISV